MTNELKVTGRILPISEATKKRNPDLFRGDSHAGLRAEKPQPVERGQGADSRMVERPAQAHYSVKIFVNRKRLLDAHDNERAACKQLVDFLTRALGFASDNDPRLQWHYVQTRSNTVSTTIIIETIQPLQKMQQMEGK